MSYNFKMKKIVYVFLGLVVALSCSPTNRTQPKKLGIKKYIAYYNTLFNGEQALEAAINNKKRSIKIISMLRIFVFLPLKINLEKSKVWIARQVRFLCRMREEHRRWRLLSISLQ